ncbi:MAG TPA: glycosyltransferase [Verrucomicrobiae bacterium]|nr:glycosyltransferase [Verrucomicrobiae bacterium]
MRILAWPKATPWNPYTAMVYSHLPVDVQVDGWPGNLLRKYSVWHMHWPDALLNIPNTVHATCKISGMFATMDCLRARGTKIVWTMHNFASHEAFHPRLEPWFWRRFIPRVDGAISLSAAGLSMALERFLQLRRVPTTVIPHGHYRERYLAAPADARRVLGIPENANVLMFFGAVRAYKNVDVLVRAFRDVKRDDSTLYVVGKPNSSELADRIMKEAFQDRRVALKFEFANDKDVSAYISAADLVVLPYREVLNSGSALLALSCNRPIMVPDRGSMGELKAEFGDAWVRTFRGEVDGSMLESGLEWAKQLRPAVCPMPEKYNWDHVGSETVRFFEVVVSGAKSGEHATAPLVSADEGASR